MRDGNRLASSAVAGAGTGMSPCAHLTVPEPSSTADETILSAPSSSKHTAAPAMSIIESTAPTSWKQTSPISRPWIFASASAMTVKIFRESALALPDSPEFSISFFISENGLCA